MRLSELVASELRRVGLPEQSPKHLPEDTLAFPIYRPCSSFGDDPNVGFSETRSCRPELQGPEVAGLYIAGSSVFPTAGHANPTLMIVALAIRLADWLKRHEFADSVALSWIRRNGYLLPSSVNDSRRKKFGGKCFHFPDCEERRLRFRADRILLLS